MRLVILHIRYRLLTTLGKRARQRLNQPVQLWPLPCSPVRVSCPMCGAVNYYIVRSALEVEQESRLRARFVEVRLGHYPAGLEGMDLTLCMEVRQKL